MEVSTSMSASQLMCRSFFRCWIVAAVVAVVVVAVVVVAVVVVAVVVAHFSMLDCS